MSARGDGRRFEAASPEGARELAKASEAGRAPLCFRCRCGGDPLPTAGVDVTSVELAPEGVEGW